jgi:D-serine deaminase-like pyridoxal phosphate-dependent protein
MAYDTKVPESEATRAQGAPGLTRRGALGAAMAAGLALDLTAGTAHAKPGSKPRDESTVKQLSRGLGAGGRPMTLASVAAVGKRIGKGEPLAIVDLAAVDHNCRVVMQWSAEHKLAWRPAFKTLRSPELLAYVVAKLDRPRVMIHHLRDLPQAMTRLPAGTDFLMGYPPTVGELVHYLRTPPTRGERPYTLRINVDNLGLLRTLVELTKHMARKPPIDVTFEIYNGIPRGGLDPGAELSEALRIMRGARGRLRLSALLCYDALAAGISDPAIGQTAARFAQSQLKRAFALVADQAHDFVDARRLIRNGPGSANYRNWAGSDAANEFSAGSAVLFADYLDGYKTVVELAKALYLCAPVLRIPKNSVLGGGGFSVPDGSELVFIKAGGWPTGLGAVLSKLVYPRGLGEAPQYGRGANSSGMITAPKGALRLGDYVVETAQQVMEGQDYFGGLYATREGKVRAQWPVVTRWTGVREELP